MVLYTTVDPEIRRPKQEDCEFKGSLHDTVNLVSRETKEVNMVS